MKNSIIIISVLGCAIVSIESENKTKIFKTTKGFCVIDRENQTTTMVNKGEVIRRIGENTDLIEKVLSNTCTSSESVLHELICFSLINLNESQRGMVMPLIGVTEIN